MRTNCFVVTITEPVYCEITDAHMGSRTSVYGDRYFGRLVDAVAYRDSLGLDYPEDWDAPFFGVAVKFSTGEIKALDVVGVYAPATTFECEVHDFGFAHSPLCNESDMMVPCDNYFPF